MGVATLKLVDKQKPEVNKPGGLFKPELMSQEYTLISRGQIREIINTLPDGSYIAGVRSDDFDEARVMECKTGEEKNAETVYVATDGMRINRDHATD